MKLLSSIYAALGGGGGGFFASYHLIQSILGKYVNWNRAICINPKFVHSALLRV